MFKIDGNYLEGGGQLTRTSLMLSSLTQQPIHIYNIRQGRSQPGLKNQHYHAIQALKQICNATVENLEVGSKEIKFFPSTIEGKTIFIDIGTAGSITLLIQNLLLPLLFADNPSRIRIKGGTEVSFSPTIDYLQNIILPSIKNYCKDISLNIEKHGYYPKGNGLVELNITPKFKLNEFQNFAKFLAYIRDFPINLVDQKAYELTIISNASSDLKKAKVAERQANTAEILLNNLGIAINKKINYFDTLSTGSSITIFSEPSFIGSDSLGEKGKSAEKVAQDATTKLLFELNSRAAIDKHLADNLIPFLALFLGRIKTSEITNHTHTNIWVCEQFLPVKFYTEKNLIECKTL